ncbi:transposase [Flagellimonas amoyensis]|uniref:transposase n=1 Tax=Flagellimonas amoyensis TaxID=2169401 RepID=UPI000D36170D|nr:transposase [Allomuricauda amoyensis]
MIESEAQLYENYGLARSVCGIGLVTAAFMLVITNNFTSFENGREYACYAGIASFVG